MQLNTANKNTMEKTKYSTTTRKMQPRKTCAHLKGNFRLYDEVGNLKLYSEPNDKGQKGSVFVRNKNVMKCFPRVKSVKIDSEKDLNLPDVTKTLFFDNHEGCLIRVYYADNDWRVSTQRKIDAFKSRWSSAKSFGELWVDALTREYKTNEKFNTTIEKSTLPNEATLLSKFFSVLDVNQQYLFILLHDEDNRIVCEAAPDPTLFHVGTWNKGQLNPLDDSLNCTKSYQHTFPTQEALLAHILTLNPKYLTGVLCYDGNTWTKYQNDAYLNLEMIRGNEPSLKFRYLQLRLDANKVEELYRLFPKRAALFDEQEDYIYGMAQYIHRAYLDRFIKRKFVTLEREFFAIMRICHEFHKADRQYNKVSLDKVIEVINTRYDHVLNKMIRMYKRVLEENEKMQTSHLHQDLVEKR
jgi:hypothetical protein